MRKLTEIDPTAATVTWLHAFETALCRGDGRAAGRLFVTDGVWRDQMAFTGDAGTMSGWEEIGVAFERTLPATRPSQFRIAPDRAAPRLVTPDGVPAIEALIAFDTLTGPAGGVLRLVPGPGGVLAALELLTARGAML